VILIVGMSLTGYAAEPPPELRPLHSYLSASGEHPDLLQAKLLIDRIIDSSIDAGAVTRQVEALVSKVGARIPAGASRRARLDLLLSSLYEPGAWNERRPFTYDLDDPLGKNPRTKLLASYLETRKGNCVSMPILFVILGQRLGLPVTLAVAPHHLLVKYLDDDGTWLNVEATSGGFKYDSSYERELGVSPRAIESRIYLRPLTPREAVGRMLGTLMEHYGRGRSAERIATADLALSLDARDVDAMLHAGTGYAVLGDAIKQRYPDPADLPVELHDTVRYLQQANLGLFAQAEELGWVEPTPEQTAAYLRSIEREKTKRGIKP
jgi:regulator of sirC expression with transglutaminase-like and TPR domain